LVPFTKIFGRAIIWELSCHTVFGVSTDKSTEVARGLELPRGQIMFGRIMFGQLMFGQIRHAARHTGAALVWKIRVHACFV
jgi:hypothetical protein